MRRRDLLVAWGAAALVRPGRAAAQAGRVYRLAILAPTTNGLSFARTVLVSELSALGFADGRDLVVEGLSGDGTDLSELARAAVARTPDAIVAVASPAILASSAATRTIPIVVYGGDPVRLGIAQSTVRPGGNVTGISVGNFDFEPKRLQLLSEAVPDRRRIGVLLHSGLGAKDILRAALEDAARQLRLELVIAEASGRPDYANAFAAFREGGAEALLITAQSVFFRDVDELARLSAATRLPTICEWPEMTGAGCMLGYGPDREGLYRRVASIVAMVFKGAAPGSIPIEEPTELDLRINLTVARSLGVTLPAALLARADEVVE